MVVAIEPSVEDLFVGALPGYARLFRATGRNRSGRLLLDRGEPGSPPGARTLKDL
jgi:hypothetical protein